MTVLLNQRVFTSNNSDVSEISKVRAQRLGGGTTRIVFETGDKEKTKKVFDCLRALNIPAKLIEGDNHWVCFREKDRSVENIAKALLELKEKKLLSQELFTKICANFPSEIINLTDDCVAKIVGVEPNLDLASKSYRDVALQLAMSLPLLPSPLLLIPRFYTKEELFATQTVDDGIDRALSDDMASKRNPLSKLFSVSKVDPNDKPFSEEIDFRPPVKITRDGEVIEEIASILSASDAPTDIPLPEAIDYSAPEYRPAGFKPFFNQTIRTAGLVDIRDVPVITKDVIIKELIDEIDQELSPTKKNSTDGLSDSSFGGMKNN